MSFGYLTYKYAPLWFNDALQEARYKTPQEAETIKKAVQAARSRINPQETPELDKELHAIFNAKRHEIIFAVCCLESYLFEWVRDEVLRHDIAKHDKFFSNKPPAQRKPEPKWRKRRAVIRNRKNVTKGQGRKGIKDKWKEVPKALKKEGYIRNIPNLSNNLWGKEFMYLVDLRDSFIHASISRPTTPRNPGNINIPDREAPISLYSIDDIQLGWATKIVVDLITALHATVGTPTPSWLVYP